jgi:hypothetical protein
VEAGGKWRRLEGLGSSGATALLIDFSLHLAVGRKERGRERERASEHVGDPRSRMGRERPAGPVKTKER